MDPPPLDRWAEDEACVSLQAVTHITGRLGTPTFP
jgi:hypothetical protein